MAKKLDARLLREEASEAVNKGKYKKALDKYLKLEMVDPANANWSRRAGDMYRRINKDDQAVVAFGRSVDRYMKAGFLVKAIAVCKLILAIQPDHLATLEHLASINQLRGMPSGPRATGEVKAIAEAPRSVSPPAPAVEPAVEPAHDRTLPPPVSLPAPAVPAAVSAPSPVSPPPSPAPRQSGTADSMGAIEIDVYAELLDLAVDADDGDDDEIVIIESLPPVAQPTPPPVPPRRRTLPPGQPLESVSLASVIPDARRISDHDDASGVSEGVIEIPLDLDLELEYTFDEVDDGGEFSAEALRALRDTPLFATLSPESLHSLITKVELVELEPGQQLFREGDTGSTLYVVAEGEVAVISEGPPRATLSTLGESQFFGEISLETNQPRSATIEATARTELLAIERDVFGELVDDEPAVLKPILRFLRDRLINRLVHTSPLFGQFSDDDRRSLAGKFRFLEVEAGSIIIEQGAVSDGLFVVLSGSLEVFMVDAAGERRLLAVLGSGDLCGEMSLLANDDAIASVQATTKAFVLELPAATFRTVIMTHPQVLMYVGELADERRTTCEAIIAGSADYEATRLDLV